MATGKLHAQYVWLYPKQSICRYADPIIRYIDYKYYYCMELDRQRSILKQIDNTV